jgi:hypothetical protein
MKGCKVSKGLRTEGRKDDGRTERRRREGRKDGRRKEGMVCGTAQRWEGERSK